MTSDEIRKWHSAFEGKDVTAEVARARARIEIAAQLAEMNEHFRKVDESVFGSPHAKKEENKKA